MNKSNTTQMFKVGYTTGVFDLFHIGHLNLLRRAKDRVTKLIVGVTTDDLVAYKNKKVVIPFEERRQIIESLRCVDEVVAQTDMDKLSAWRRLQFNAVFVGSDWQGTDVWRAYEQQFAIVGVEVVYFPYTEGTSSTQLREFIDNWRS